MEGIEKTYSDIVRKQGHLDSSNKDVVAIQYFCYGTMI
jgi:hypothetical protein